jgi:bacterial/archaeal transporter family-2 protein
MWYLYGIVLLAGIANAIQPGQNGALAKGLPQPLTAGLVVGLGTFLTVLIAGVLSGRLALPTYDEAARIPWWAWFGGVMGGGIVATQLLVAQKVGAAAFTGLLVTAGVITSIALDHFGWVGFERHAATLPRILGGFLMIGGVALIASS